MEEGQGLPRQVAVFEAGRLESPLQSQETGNRFNNFLENRTMNQNLSKGNSKTDDTLIYRYTEA